MGCRIKILTNEMALDMIKSVDGDGSELDADLLDGLQAVDFALANHGHTGLLTQAEYDQVIELINSSGGSTDWADITNKPTTFAPEAHNHDWSALNIATIPVFASRWPTWVEVSDKPSTFPPGTHDHDWSAIVSGIPQTATRWPTWLEITDKPSTFPPESHGHSNATPTTAGFQSAADKSKLDGIATNAIDGFEAEQIMSQAIADASLNSLWDVDYSSFSAGSFLRAFDTGSSTSPTEWRPAFIDYSEIQNKPSTFPPSAHNQDASTITSGVFSDSRLSDNIFKLSELNQSLSAETGIDTTGYNFLFSDRTPGHNFSNYFWAKPSENALYIGSNILVPTFRANVVINDSTNATSTTSTASIRTDGGIAAQGDIYANKISYTESDVVSFTPAFEGIGWVYHHQIGYYIREGRKVEFVIHLAVDTVGTPSSILYIERFADDALFDTFFGNIRVRRTTGLPNSYYWTPYVNRYGNIFLQYTHGSNSTVSTLTALNLDANCAIYLSGSYITAS